MKPDPSVKKIDTHHHLWDLKAHYYTWLDGNSPNIAGQFPALGKDYLVSDYLADLSGTGVVKSIHVQANAGGAGAGHDLRETRWLQALADDPKWQGFPHAIVAYADLGAPDVEAVLEAHCESPNLRGIRQSLIQHKVDPTRPDPRTNPAWAAGFSLLAKRQLSFDLQVFHPDMAFGADLASRNPDVQFILTHLGFPMLQHDSEYMGHWRKGMKLLAQRPNVAVKISGFAMFDRQWTAEKIKPITLEAIELFGTKRCMFASNFPVENMSGTYADYWAAYEATVMDLSADEQADLFYNSATRLYRV